MKRTVFVTMLVGGLTAAGIGIAAAQSGLAIITKPNLASIPPTVTLPAGSTGMIVSCVAPKILESIALESGDVVQRCVTPGAAPAPTPPPVTTATGCKSGEVARPSVVNGKRVVTCQKPDFPK